MDYLSQRTPLRKGPAELLPGARTVIAVTLNYRQPNPPTPGSPKVAQYALGRDYHRVMRGKLARIATWLETRDEQARVCVDSAPIFERDYAHLAGLGWFGKNTCLIDTKRGSFFFIGLILTTAEIPPDRPARGGCGTCTRCIDACPTGAIRFADGRWQIDSRRCISYATIEHRGPLEISSHGWTFGCDICQEVCPFNAPSKHQPMRAQDTVEPDFQPRELPSLVELAEMDYETWEIMTRGSALRRAGWQGLVRNARANLTSGE